MDRTRRTILCVEDDDLQLQLRKALFQSAGFDVLLAASGQEAVSLMESNQIDAVVLDYWMAGMDGLSVAREMKQREPRLPILLLSGVSSLPEETSQLVDACFQKSRLGPQELIDEVSALIASRNGSKK